MKITNKHKAKLMILAWLMSFEVYTSGGFTDDEEYRKKEDEFYKQAWNEKENKWKSLSFVVKDKYDGIKTLAVQPNGSDIQGAGGKYTVYCFDDLNYANAHYFECFHKFLNWEWVEIPDEEIERIKKFNKI